MCTLTPQTSDKTKYAKNQHFRAINFVLF